MSRRTRRIRRLSVAGAAVVAVGGLATGASGALDRSGGERPEVRLVVNEDDKGPGDRHGDCPGKRGGGADPSDAASAL